MPAPQPMDAPAPIKAQNPDLTQASKLASAKDIVDDKPKKTVEYGSTGKKSGAAQGKKVDTSALAIKLNNPGGNTAGQGGINV